MRFHLVSLVTLLNALTVASLLIPRDVTSLSIREEGWRLNDLFKRKGGGGGGKGGGSSSSSSSSSSSGSSSSSSGGRTTSGGTSSSGVRSSPSYGGGRFYGGGATTPYRAGGRTPGGLTPLVLLPVAAVAGIYGGLWLSSVYLYSYPRPYSFYNTTESQNQTKPVLCLCQENSPCGCDNSNDDNTFLNDIIGNGSYAALNNDLVRVSTVNGTSTIAINGTLQGTVNADGSVSVSSAAVSAASPGAVLPGHVAWMALAGVLSAAIATL